MIKDIKYFNWSDEVVLIADDDRYNHLLLEKVIKQTNATVLHAYTGKEAEELLNNNKVTIAILDIVMPFINGIQLVRKVKQILPDTLFIAYTADIVRHNSEVCKDAGFKACFAKPTLPFRLLKEINKHLESQTKKIL